LLDSLLQETSSRLVPMSGSMRDDQPGSPSNRLSTLSPGPEEGRPPSIVQEEGNIMEGSANSYTSMASKTVANIRRLQENMAVSQPWASSVMQVPAQSAASATRQPVRGQAAPLVEQENCCLPPESEVLQQPPENVETLSTFHKPLLVALPSPPPSPRLQAQSPENSLHLSTQDPNWQSNKNSVRERNSAMFNNSLMADIHFLVGPASSPRRIPAHRYVLATGSTVFYAMLYGGLADVDCEDIAVPDVDPEAFLGLLKYLYCDDIYLEPDTVLATLYAAKKYIVPHLARECVKYLETSLTARNACLLLSQSRLFEEPELMQRCWDVIDAQAEIALKSEGFTDIDFHTLQTILTRETLNCGEITVFHAAREWARAECVRREEEPSPENMRSALMHQ